MPTPLIKAFKSKIKRIPRTFFYVVLFLAALRIALPTLALHTINWALSKKLDQYEGRIEDFDLSLYRGAYQLQGLVIQKKKSDLPPLVSVKEIDLSIAWRALFRGEICSNARLDTVILRFIDNEEKKATQFGNEESKNAWQDTLELLFPLSIENLWVQNSEVQLEHLGLKKPASVRLTHFTLRVKDLRNRRNLKKDLQSPFWITASLQDSAPLNLSGRIDVLSQPYRIDADLQLTDFEINSINQLLMAYIPLDVTRGKLSMYAEAAMAHHRAKGYAKIFLNQADIISSKQKFVSLKHFIYEILSAAGNWLLKNKKTENLAAYVPLDWDGTGLHFSSSQIFWSAVENNKTPLRRGVDHSIDLKKVE